MIVFSWNCRGLGQPHAVPILCELVRAHKLDVVFLFDTFSHSIRIEDICIRLSFKGIFSVDCVGRGGGICVFWKIDDSCSIMGFSQNHLILKLLIH